MNKEALQNQLKSIYSERRTISENKRDRLLKNYLQNNPQIADNLSKSAAYRWDQLENTISRALVKRDSEQATSPEEISGQADSTAKITEAKTALSKSIDFDSPETERFYEQISFQSFKCPQCQDRGLVDNRQKCPLCYNQTWKEVLRAEIPEFLPNPKHVFSRVEFELFSDETLQFSGRKTSPRKQIARNYNEAEKFLQDFPVRDENLFFTGKTGTGKTFLAESIANALISRNYLALVVSALSVELIINELRVKQNTYGVKPSELAEARGNYELLLDADLLVIDDFGISSGIMQNPLAELLNLFHSRQSKAKQTIITTNYNLQELKNIYDERLLSRILQKFQILPFLGDDLRLKGGQHA